MDLLPLDSPHWKQYRAGYNRAKIDIVPWLETLLHGTVADGHWDILWDDLHHQGDVGEASYAIVPYLAKYVEISGDINWHIYGFSATVELARDIPGNPPVPQEILGSYERALSVLPRLAINSDASAWPSELLMGVSACLALSRGHRLLAEAYLHFSPAEAKDFLP